MPLNDATLDRLALPYRDQAWSGITPPLVVELVDELKQARALVADLLQSAGVHQDQGMLMCESCGMSTVDAPLFTGTDADIDHDARCPYTAATAYLKAAGMEVK